MIAPVRKKGRWALLISCLLILYSLSRYSAPREPHLGSRSLLTSAQWHGSDVENAVGSTTGEVEVHIPDNMMQNWEKGSRIRQASMIIGNQHMSVFKPCMETVRIIFPLLNKKLSLGTCLGIIHSLDVFQGSL